MQPKIVWKGERIQCMKSARTSRCKLCMKERREILKRYQIERKLLINDNSDIFSSCKCGAKFHKFIREVNLQEALRTRSTQKKVKSSKLSERMRKKNPPRFDFSDISIQTTVCTPCHSVGMTSPSSVEEPASSQPMTPVIFYDTNVPGLPYRTPPLTQQDSSLLKSENIRTFLRASQPLMCKSTLVRKKEHPTCHQLQVHNLSPALGPQTRTQSRPIGLD